MAITYTPGKPEQKEFQLLKAGIYKLKVVECKADTTKKTGEDCLNVTLKHENGTNVFDVMLFRDTTIWKFHQFVKACGGDPESGTFDEDSAIGTEIEVKIGVEIGKGEYVGKDKNRVDAYLFEKEDF